MPPCVWSEASSPRPFSMDAVTLKQALLQLQTQAKLFFAPFPSDEAKRSTKETHPCEVATATKAAPDEQRAVLCSESSKSLEAQHHETTKHALSEKQQKNDQSSHGAEVPTLVPVFSHTRGEHVSKQRRKGTESQTANWDLLSPNSFAATLIRNAQAQEQKPKQNGSQSPQGSSSEIVWSHGRAFYARCTYRVLAPLPRHLPQMEASPRAVPACNFNVPSSLHTGRGHINQRTARKDEPAQVILAAKPVPLTVFPSHSPPIEAPADIATPASKALSVSAEGQINESCAVSFDAQLCQRLNAPAAAVLHRTNPAANELKSPKVRPPLLDANHNQHSVSFVEQTHSVPHSKPSHLARAPARAQLLRQTAHVYPLSAETAAGLSPDSSMEATSAAPQVPLHLRRRSLAHRFRKGFKSALSSAGRAIGSRATARSDVYLEPTLPGSSTRFKRSRTVSDSGTQLPTVEDDVFTFNDLLTRASGPLRTYGAQRRQKRSRYT